MNPVLSNTSVNRGEYYKLVGKKVVPVNDVVEWSKSLQENKIVKQEHTDAGYWVSTVFLGIDHSFSLNPKQNSPILFETMVFGKGNKEKRKSDLDIERYVTYLQAEKGHERMVKTWSTNEVALRKIEQ